MIFEPLTNKIFVTFDVQLGVCVFFPKSSKGTSDKKNRHREAIAYFL